MTPERFTKNRQLADFEGRWRMTRRIESAQGGQAGLFQGIACFTPLKDGLGKDGLGKDGLGKDALAYEEAGELRLPDQGGLQAKRRYIWQKGASGGIDVVFEDGSDFHHIDLSSPVATAWYDCLPDFYEVSYTFIRWPDWRVIWRVKGLKKEYTMITDYTMAGENANTLARG